VEILLNGSTGISTQPSTPDVEPSTFSIDGRRITTKNPRKGLYIKGNRKVLY